MSGRPLSLAMREALVAMLKGPLAHGRETCGREGWLATDRTYFAPSVVRNLRERGLVIQHERMAVLSIAGRKEATRRPTETA